MRLLKLFQKCVHDWKEFEWGVVETPNGKAWTVELYCPKCDRIKSVFKRDWDNKRKLQLIKDTYEIKRSFR